MDLGQQFIRLQAGFKVVDEKIVQTDDPLTMLIGSRSPSAPRARRVAAKSDAGSAWARLPPTCSPVADRHRCQGALHFCQHGKIFFDDPMSPPIDGLTGRRSATRLFYRSGCNPDPIGF